MSAEREVTTGGSSIKGLHDDGGRVVQHVSEGCFCTCVTPKPFCLRSLFFRAMHCTQLDTCQAGPSAGIGHCALRGYITMVVMWGSMRLQGILHVCHSESFCRGVLDPFLLALHTALSWTPVSFILVLASVTVLLTVLCFGLGVRGTQRLTTGRVLLQVHTHRFGKQM